MPLPDKNKLIPSLSIAFKGIIWRVETDDKLPIVAIETRDISNRITYYSAFNFQTGACLFKEVTVQDSWFWSINRIHKGLIFLHSYVHEGSPEHKGIIAINLSGTIEWQHFHKTLEDVAAQGLIIYNPKIQPKSFELASPEDGSTIHSNVKDYQYIERDIIIPDVVDDFVGISNFLPENSFGPIFFTHFNFKNIMVYHIKNENYFDQQLAVYQDGELLLEDNLALGIQKLNPEAFFIERSHLFYIRNDKHDFVSYLV
ncbi:MAG: DUF4905 domain-containing protein [Pyrinomonadaceae bacterium]|nr:DUF4905 domain-containing protein [Sphingobacteriaceae bacterium]